MRGYWLKPLSEDGWSRLLRRVRRLEGEARKVADRLVEESLRQDRDLREIKRELEATRTHGLEVERYSRHLADRLNEVFGLLTDAQRVEMKRRDSESEPFRFSA